MWILRFFIFAILGKLVNTSLDDRVNELLAPHELYDGDSSSIHFMPFVKPFYFFQKQNSY